MNSFNMDTNELPGSILAAPSLITIAGPTASGKSCIVIDILKNADKLFAQPVEGVVYFYSETQELFKSAQGTQNSILAYRGGGAFRLHH